MNNKQSEKLTEDSNLSKSQRKLLSVYEIFVLQFIFSINFYLRDFK